MPSFPRLHPLPLLERRDLGIRLFYESCIHPWVGEGGILQEEVSGAETVKDL